MEMTTYLCAASRYKACTLGENSYVATEILSAVCARDVAESDHSAS